MYNGYEKEFDEAYAKMINNIQLKEWDYKTNKAVK